MSQVTENAATADALMQGRSSVWGDFKLKDASVFSRLGKHGKPVKANFVAGKRASKSSEPKIKWMSFEEGQELRDANDCFICKDEGHKAHDCPNKKKRDACDVKAQKYDHKDKYDKGKKPKTIVVLVLDVIGGKEKEDASKPMQAWGNVQD